MRTRLFTVFFLLTFAANGSKLEKGFEKLKVFDYFAAKEYFEKSLDDDPAAAAFGLSSIYSTDKNPFYNTDSARKYILISDSTFRKLKEKTKKEYAELGVSQTSIDSLSISICEDAFNRAENIDSVDSYNHYLQYFTTCRQRDEVIALRNAAAFDDASELQTSAAFKEFMARYPQSEQYKKALARYDELVFEEATVDRTIQSYEQFLIDYPESPYRPQAEKKIYTLTVPDKTLVQYEAYVRKYKSGRFVSDAWREIYKMSMKDFSRESFEEFKQKYPDYPFPGELESDYQLQNYFFLPVKNENKWGYINEQGEEMIKPVYDEVSLFSEGLAVVSSDGKYGYINKSGNKVIKLHFEDAESFHNGGAVVRLDSLYALINKNGDLLIQPEYDELTEASDDIYMAVKDDVSGYITRHGDSLTGFVFDMAGEFVNGNAIVNQDEKYGLLNVDGQYKIQTEFSELVFIGDKLLKALNEEEVWGIVNDAGDTILPFEYDVIGEFNEGLALVSKNGKCGFADERGQVRIPLNFVYTPILLTTGRFENGYALLKQKNKSIIVDTTGKVFSFGNYEDYGRPSGGFIPVRKNKRWGYAGMDKKLRIPCKFEEADSFSNGLAKIRQNKLAGLIDTTGKIFVAALYDDIVVLENGFMIRSGGKTGFFSKVGILLIPCQYEKIEFLSPTIARAINAEGFTYFNLENGRVIYSSQ